MRTPSARQREAKIPPHAFLERPMSTEVVLASLKSLESQEV